VSDISSEEGEQEGDDDGDPVEPATNSADGGTLVVNTQIICVCSLPLPIHCCSHCSLPIWIRSGKTARELMDENGVCLMWSGEYTEAASGDQAVHRH
jgi:hypothetical protein